MKLKTYSSFSLLTRFWALGLLLAFASCGGDGNSDDNGGGEGRPTEEAYWNTSATDKATVRADNGQVPMILPNNVGSTYEAQVTDGTWASFSLNGGSAQKSGTIQTRKDVLFVYFSENNTDAERTATITISTDGQAPQTFYIAQLSGEQQDQPSFGGTWAEIPAEKSNPNYTYVTHTITLNNKKVRNYSLCFDKSVRAALWVAYPMHSAYQGGQGRTDDWAMDPLVDERWQPNCVFGSYKGSYDRGHQIASGDRTASREMNEQTFYMSNMTPQLGKLNQQMWANLEGKVRGNSCADTLYVVTGAYFGPNGKGDGSTTDAVGNTCPLPTYYYKVLLRTRNGNTGKAIKDCQPDELKSIGFWVKHAAASGQPTASICKTVEEIEKETGFTFFPQVAASVKRQNIPSDWSINN
ncbi:MAG: DNA/RNA non-specific endonuclease [Mediterranea sp.]|jgi:endonuclease G|nr:DNA/RNA non-specific endonuclease [Mediterranea sp.]